MMAEMEQQQTSNVPLTPPLGKKFTYEMQNASDDSKKASGRDTKETSVDLDSMSEVRHKSSSSSNEKENKNVDTKYLKIQKENQRIRLLLVAHLLLILVLFVVIIFLASTQNGSSSEGQQQTNCENNWLDYDQQSMSIARKNSHVKPNFIQHHDDSNFNEKEEIKTSTLKPSVTTDESRSDPDEKSNDRPPTEDAEEEAETGEEDVNQEEEYVHHY